MKTTMITKSLGKVSLLTLLLMFPLVTLADECPDGTCGPGETVVSCPRDCLLSGIRQVHANGGRLDWCPDGSDVIAFDKRSTDNYFDVWTMQPDGSDVRCLTCDHPKVPQKHNGQPAWHPSGKWLVFQAEWEDHRGRAFFSHPGRGKYNDLWIMRGDGSDAQRLIRPDELDGGGVLHAHFSHDGTMLSWSQLSPGRHNLRGGLLGAWKLKVGDFRVTERGPEVTNIRTFQPADEVFYENHGFSPDRRSILFTSNMHKDKSPLTANNIYTLDLETEELTQLTFEGYNEHASYSPDGGRIIWGSNRSNKNRGMDYWIMDADGSNKKQLTYFNRKGHPEWSKKKSLAVDQSWSPDGRHLIGYVQVGIGGQSGDIYLISLDGQEKTGR